MTKELCNSHDDLQKDNTYLINIVRNREQDFLAIHEQIGERHAEIVELKYEVDHERAQKVHAKGKRDLATQKLEEVSLAKETSENKLKGELDHTTNLLEETKAAYAQLETMHPHHFKDCKIHAQSKEIEQLKVDLEKMFSERNQWHDQCLEQWHLANEQSGFDYGWNHEEDQFKVWDWNALWLKKRLTHAEAALSSMAAAQADEIAAKGPLRLWGEMHGLSA